MKNLLASAAAALIVGIVGGYFIGHSQTSSSGNDLFSIQSDIPPAEFLYLDYGRVLPYLSQLENGLTSSQLRTLSRSTSLNAGAEAGQGIKVGGTFASQNSLQETVTPTAASQFYLLENRLKQRHWLQQLNATPHNFVRFRNALHAVEEGGFVRITNCRLVYPVYARLYPALKKKSPALPLSLKVFGRGTGQEVDLLFPVAYASLANEPSLYSTRLTVLGKVIRQVDSENPHYVDVETQHAFEQAVDQHPALVERLDLTPTLLERQFSAAVSVNAPGAVVLPIAIFK